MKINFDGNSTVIIDNDEFKIQIEKTCDGFVITNLIEKNAIFRHRTKRNKILLTNAQPIADWKNFELIPFDPKLI